MHVMHLLDIHIFQHSFKGRGGCISKFKFGALQSSGVTFAKCMVYDKVCKGWTEPSILGILLYFISLFQKKGMTLPDVWEKLHVRNDIDLGLEQ